MPSARYHERQARILLDWAKATRDGACARRLSVQAAKELEKAERSLGDAPDFERLLVEFNTGQLLSRR
jgi:hypothetical protein